MDRDCTVIFEYYAGILLRAAAGTFDKAGKTNAMAPAIDFLTVQIAQPIVSNRFKYTLQGRLVVAGIINEGLFVRNQLARRIRKLVLPDQVDAAKIGCIDTEIVRSHV